MANLSALLSVVAVWGITLASFAAPASANAPVLISISPGNPWPISPPGMPNAPVTVRFMPADGATNYAIVLVGPMLFNMPLNTYLKGEFIESSFVLPPQAVSGNYQLRIQPLDNLGNPIGQSSASVPFNTITQVPVPFAPNGHLSANGVMLVSDINIPPGVVVSVTQELTLYSVGPAHIEGEIRGMDGLFPGGSGASITINAGGPVQVYGKIQAGAGAKGIGAKAAGAPGQPASAQGGNGGDGGMVAIRTLNVPIAIYPTAHVESGKGGDGGVSMVWGGSANQPTQRGGDAHSSGGDGGDGGDLCVYSQSLFPNALTVPVIPGILVCNDGGNGGNARARGGNGGAGIAGVDGGFGAFGGTTDTRGGAGGNSGYLMINTMDWDGDGIVTQVEFHVVAGGRGGDTGATVYVQGQDGGNAPSQPPSCTCENIPPPAPVKDEKPKAGDGWAEPSNGRPAKAVGKRGKGCGKGQDAIAKGGDGGNLRRIGFDFYGFGIQWNVAAGTGGRGGNAEARGGDGGPDGGDGGSATATGGNGGNGPIAPPIAGGGGNGGEAVAVGGNGGNAKDCCSPPLPARVPGGNGGTAEAAGGKGGDANTLGGNGGNASAQGGSAGSGGDGCGPTLGGHGGTANVVVGAAGSGLILNGNDGLIGYDIDGGDGADGVNCCG